MSNRVSVQKIVTFEPQKFQDWGFSCLDCYRRWPWYPNQQAAYSAARIHIRIYHASQTH